MVISSKGRYALRVMVYLAVNHDGSFIPLKEISQHEELSQKYLESITRMVEYLKSGVVDYEFRTTVTGKLHTPEDIGAAAAWIAGAKRYFLQPFKDSGDLVGDGDFTPDAAVLADMLAHARQSVPNTELRG